MTMRDTNAEKYFDNLEKLDIEKVALSFDKFVLGVHRKAQNSGVRGELGRTVLGIDVTANVLKYKQNLVAKRTSCLLGEAYSIISNNNSRILSWHRGCNKMEQIVKDNTLTSSDLTNRRTIITRLNQTYFNRWRHKIESENKMCSYRLFKSSPLMEDYLTDVTNECHRKSLTKFRISAHTLQIERGRYTVPYTQRENRFCTHCKDKVEDEYHFIMDSPLYSDNRDILFDKLHNMYPSLLQLCPKDKFVYMLSSSGDVIRLVAAFIHENLERKTVVE